MENGNFADLRVVDSSVSLSGLMKSNIQGEFQTEPVGLSWVSNQGGSWSPPCGSMSGTSILEETPGQNENTLEELNILPGLEMLQVPP